MDSGRALLLRRTPTRTLAWAWFLGLTLCGIASGQNLIPNGDFGAGSGGRPEGWTLAEGIGSWTPGAGGRTAALRVEGRGDDAASWRTPSLPLRPGSLYRLRFRARREAGSTGGTAFVGVGAVHRDFPLGEASREYAYVFAVPHGERDPAARLGQWHVKGGIVFESAELVPVLPEHERFRDAGGIELGEGETVRAGTYVFEPDLGGIGANGSRVVVTNRVGFNSTRWLFDSGGELVFRHRIGAFALRDGRVRVAINHHTSGSLAVSVATNGAAWQVLGEFDGTKRGGQMLIPASCFPSTELWVRLEARGTRAGFQVNTYDLSARVDTGSFEAEGSTEFFDSEGRPTRPPGFLENSGSGYPLSGPAGLTLWWCEGAVKVGRRTPSPTGPDRVAGSGSHAVRVALARGEYEPAQVVLRSVRASRLREAEPTGLRDPAGKASTLELDVREVAYVHVTRPTDGSSRRGWYPDPLPPLRLPLELPENENQPLWLTVRAPAGTAPGINRVDLRLRTDDGEARVPLAFEVYDFDLPKETHLRSAFGLGMSEIVRYHRLTNRADQVAVFEKYLANFAEHRISPYSFYDHAPIEVSFPGEGANRRAKVDFEAFDRAATRWLDEAKFGTFQLPLKGMGGGTYHARHPGRLAGHDEGTPEHARLFRDYLGQVQRHLEERGWLDRAFTYWFDEPDPKDYAFVVEGMKRLKEAGPGIRRMLTEQPEPELRGHVDIWCGLTPEWTPERVRERRAAGEEVWWYICTAPKEPYVTEFIDHPGTELRLWPWQSWQYGVTGILVWATIYWTSPLAYPEPALQDPWRDPMSWVSGYGFPVGHRAPWGNGDGRFLYPPRRNPNDSPEANHDAPIDSLRWENLRDGIEDYEYLMLLRRELERLEKSGSVPRSPEDPRSLLIVPPELSRDLVRFTTDPRPLLEHRARVARAIVALRTPR
ncbi:MAG: DUF4091 domain-containing protein [Verrucomicrobiales bacterium]|nr:DUF4091 domain-containing protein [Verrucomicrobiales bacterium]